ncbi:phosphoribosyltransferase family protein [Stutzerimonas tarimensis]|uniref:Phosphoribosyltransferase family protein n=1 Tax=Stutzerimonas tarimensis TaxID=1507735 RepID=A0ABV7T4B3_9GAMM
MHYRSVNDLLTLLGKHLDRIPRNLDLVVGVSPGGLFLARMLAIKLNLPCTDLDTFERNGHLEREAVRSYRHEPLIRAREARKVLLVEDSGSGASMRELATRIAAGFPGKIMTLAAYAPAGHAEDLDQVLERLDQPAMFEWNLMQHPSLSRACLDIDGVLCVDPTHQQNDDGANYLQFLRNAQPLYIPGLQVAHLVTSRLEKYRGETEEWLDRHGVRYGQLHMLDLPSAAERRRLKVHHRFKADVYRSFPDTQLFIESELGQALDIAHLSRKPVFCIESNALYNAGWQLLALRASHRGQVLNRRVGARFGRLLGGQQPGVLAGP